MRKLLFLVSIILCGMVVMSSCSKSEEPDGDGGDSWNTYPAKTDLWEFYRGLLDKSPSQVEATLKAKGYVKGNDYGSGVHYEKTGIGVLLVKFTNSLSTTLTAEETHIQTFGDFMSYSNGLATLPYSSYFSEIGKTSYTTRDSFLKALGAADKSNIDLQETCIVNQKRYTHGFLMEKGEYQGSSMTVSNSLDIER